MRRARLVAPFVAVIFLGVLLGWGLARIVDIGERLAAEERISEQLAAALANEQDAAVDAGRDPVAPPPEQITGERVGPQGPLGPQGERGRDGRDGSDGRDGADGLTPACYFDGTNCVGPAGPQGPAGPAGADGADGVDGEAGPAGPAGADGATGPAGPQGAAGPPIVLGAECYPGHTWQERQIQGDPGIFCLANP